MKKKKTALRPAFLLAPALALALMTAPINASASSTSSASSNSETEFALTPSMLTGLSEMMGGTGGSDDSILSESKESETETEEYIPDGIGTMYNVALDYENDEAGDGEGTWNGGTPAGWENAGGNETRSETAEDTENAGGKTAPDGAEETLAEEEEDLASSIATMSSIGGESVGEEEETETEIPEISVTRVQTSEYNPCITWFVRGIEGDIEYAERDCQVYIGGEQAKVNSAGRVGVSRAVPMKTLFLIDNSTAIGRSSSWFKVNSVLARIILNHQPDEQFAIKTFGKTANTVMDFTKDYDALANALSEIPYNGRNTYLKSVLYDEISNLISEDLEYTRVVIVSDGTDNNKGGVTYEELVMLVKSEEVNFPIYTLGLANDAPGANLNNVFGLSRITDSPYFTLDEFRTSTDARAAADAICADGANLYWLRFELDPELRDGSRKSVALKVKTTAGDYNCVYPMNLPGLSVEDAVAEAKRRQKEAADKAKAESEAAEKLDASYNMAQQALRIAMEGGPTEDDLNDAESWRSRRTFGQAVKETFTAITEHTLFKILSIPALLVIILLILLLRKRKKKKSIDREMDMKRPPHEEEARSVDAVTDAARADKGVILIDMDNPSRSWRISDGQTMVLGRIASRCDISFPDDNILASRHAVVNMEGGKLYIDSIGHTDTTFVSGREVGSRLELYEGDEISLGNSKLKVRYD